MIDVLFSEEILNCRWAFQKSSPAKVCCCYKRSESSRSISRLINADTKFCAALKLISVKIRGSMEEE